MITVKAISDYLNEIAPYSTQCKWDNCGLLIGDENAEVRKIGFCLDLTKRTLDEAQQAKVDLLVTHHPIIFHAQKNLLSGNVIYALAKSGINAISAHTCYDAADGGVSDVLAEKIGLVNAVPLPAEPDEEPMLRIGELEFDKLPQPQAFAKLVAERLDTTVGCVDGGKAIKKVAVCGGAGGSFVNVVKACGADAYVTGEAAHHELLEAENAGLTLVVAGHFETEAISMQPLLTRVAQRFPEIEAVLLKQANPVSYISG